MEKEPDKLSRNYRDLWVWQKSIQFTRQIYQATSGFPTSECYGLTSQLRRAAVSIPSNIAEGQARGQVGDFIRFLNMAKGSLAEVDTQLEIAKELGYLGPLDATQLQETSMEIRRMLFGLIEYLQNQRLVREPDSDYSPIVDPSVEY